ncbi:NADPH-dependent ferric siderophore reductase [Antricoccus suffuscus]|uniref:NADPH-dependent ferric siderophore reductase n=1 Tax=Antricoccus suffuscus TaxID=1629062 RepID=A0A2T0ZZZ7_9ACTN|nr:NADPH-dependent ferric siderophore reductase [Antricoccus suffuscus]
MSGYRLFTDLRIGTVQDLSPSFRRITFRGPQLSAMAHDGPDQRIKLVLPHAATGFSTFPVDTDNWYPVWQAVPANARNPIRTFTISAVRPHRNELDVDFAVHGDGGPASAYAIAAQPGDPIFIVGPDVTLDGPPNAGVGWNPPSGGTEFVIGADETAVPAALNILKSLAENAEGTAVLEVPSTLDERAVEAPPGVRVHWVPRDRMEQNSGFGSLQEAIYRIAAHRRAERRMPALVGAETLPAPSAEEMVWEIPEITANSGPYFWLAGEAGCITSLRRQLVGELGIDRRSVAFMGYWREGRALD